MSLQTHSLIFQYNKDNHFQFPDLALAANEHLLILGPSGCGKSTLLHLLAGLLTPHAGEVLIGGVELAALRKRKREQFRGRNIGMVFQQSYFVRALNVRDNLLLAQKLAGQPQERKRVLAVLGEMGLEKKAGSKPRQLSIGEQQRVSIARAILNEPKVILADEPTSALDDPNTTMVNDLLQETAQRHGANLVVVTHDQRLKSKFKRSLALAPIAENLASASDQSPAVSQP